MTLGPLMLDLEGAELSPEERELLAHPLVGGVILFKRNAETPEQLAALTKAIHEVRTPPLLIAVDQEGGRVQRFSDGFTHLPPARSIGRQYDLDETAAKELARRVGWLMAAELRGIDVDISFAPVLDLDWGMSEVIGDRAFHRDAEVVAILASAYVAGMGDAGMAATGKHFPGHGAVFADSHDALPVDRRRYANLSEDMLPYERLGERLAGVMVAHVVYTDVDEQPAGYSQRWLIDELRGRVDFRGVVFSDDLNMEGAAVAGSMPERAALALEAGCDMILVCNNRGGACAVLDELGEYVSPVSQVRLVRLHGRHGPSWAELLDSEQWRTCSTEINRLCDQPPLQLDA